MRWSYCEILCSVSEQSCDNDGYLVLFACPIIDHNDKFLRLNPLKFKSTAGYKFLPLDTEFVVLYLDIFGV